MQTLIPIVSTLPTSFCQYFQPDATFVNGVTNDVIIQVVDSTGTVITRIAANSQIISQNSAYFKTLFTTHLGTQQTIANLQGFDPDILNDVITYLYGCNIVIDDNNAIYLYKYADYLGIPWLKDETYKYIVYMISDLDLVSSTDRDEFISLLIEADELGNTEIVSLFIKELAKYFNYFAVDTSFLLQISNPNIISELLTLDMINVLSEMELIDFVEKWRTVHYKNNDVEFNERWNQIINDRIIPYLRLATLNKTGLSIPQLGIHEESDLDKAKRSKLADLSRYQSLIIEAENYVQRWDEILTNKRSIPRTGVVNYVLENCQNCGIIKSPAEASKFNYDFIIITKNSNLIASVSPDLTYMLSRGIIGPGSLISFNGQYKGTSHETQFKLTVDNIQLIYGHVPKVYYKK